MRSIRIRAAAHCDWDTRRFESGRKVQASAMEGLSQSRSSDWHALARFDLEFGRSSSVRFRTTFPWERKPQRPCWPENNGPREIFEYRMVESDGELPANHRS